MNIPNGVLAFVGKAEEWHLAAARARVANATAIREKWRIANQCRREWETALRSVGIGAAVGYPHPSGSCVRTCLRYGVSLSLRQMMSPFSVVPMWCPLPYERTLALMRARFLAGRRDLSDAAISALGKRWNASHNVCRDCWQRVMLEAGL